MKKKLIMTVYAICLLGCKAGPPSGSETISRNILAVSGGIQPTVTQHFISVTKLYDCSEYSNDCTDNEIEFVDDAIVTISKNSITYSATVSSEGWHYYVSEFGPIKPGDSLNLQVTHPDFDLMWSDIIVPDSVKFTYISANTLDPNDEKLEFHWEQNGNTEGYDSHLFLHIEFDSMSIDYPLNDYYNKDEYIGWDNLPNRSLKAEFGMEMLINQLEDNYYIKTIENIKKLYLEFRVYSLDEAYYFSELWQNKPDEYSSFSAPLIYYSNIENGVGVFGSFWVTKSKPIFVDTLLFKF